MKIKKIIYAISFVSFSGCASPQINFYYLKPSDRALNPNYINGIQKAALSIQAFYKHQLKGKTFAIASPIVTVINSSNDSNWHAQDMWNRAILTVGAKFNDPEKSYVIYVDALQACVENNTIGGTSGVAVLAENDLHGLSGEPIRPDCKGYVEISQLDRWIGGLGHELGHALGLPHPKGCESGPDQCDENSIMWMGYRTYPHTYLNSDEKNILLQSKFIKNKN